MTELWERPDDELHGFPIDPRYTNWPGPCRATRARKGMPGNAARRPRAAGRAQTCTASNSPGISGIYSVNDDGVIVRPHRHRNGCFKVILRGNLSKDQINVRANQLTHYLARGYKLRMSAPGYSPSLFAPASIRGWRHYS